MAHAISSESSQEDWVMKNPVNVLSRITLTTAIVAGLVVGVGAVPAFAKKKAAAAATPATSEATRMAGSDQAKSEAKHHKKHHKEKSAAESSESTTPKQ
jgi:F0F1-type ATP synthase membrane subunit c/vacuolar-type H+-ATPase subunit K